MLCVFYGVAAPTSSSLHVVLPSAQPQLSVPAPPGSIVLCKREPQIQGVESRRNAAPCSRYGE